MGVSSMLPTINSLGIYICFLKVFGVLRTFLQKGSKPPEAVPPFPYKPQFYSSLYPKFATVAALSLQFSLTLTQRFR